MRMGYVGWRYYLESASKEHSSPLRDVRLTASIMTGACLLIDLVVVVVYVVDRRHLGA